MFGRWTRTLALPLLLAAGACGDNEFPDDPMGVGGEGEIGAVRGSVLSAEGGVGAVRIILVDVDSTLTAADGTYEFADLIPATYNLQLRLPAGFRLAPGQESLRQVSVPGGGAAVADWTLVEE